jgi:hypothetical protein
MEPLLVVSGFLLARQMKKKKRRAISNTGSSISSLFSIAPNPLPSVASLFSSAFEDPDHHPGPTATEPPQYTGTTDAGGVDGSGEPEPRGRGPTSRVFTPGWMRATAPPPQLRTEGLRRLSDPQADRVDPMSLTRAVSQRAAALNQHLQGTHDAPVERQFERPPRRGGDEGYDDVRGRDPLPRYNRYDLGPELTTGMRDMGAVRGRGDTTRGRTEGPDSWDILPDRTMHAPPREQPLLFRPLKSGKQRLGAIPLASGPDQADRSGLSWENGPTGRVAPARKARVYPETDPTDRGNADATVESFVASQGAHGRGEILKEPIRGNVGAERVLQTPEGFVTSRGMAAHAEVPHAPMPRGPHDTMHRLEVASLPGNPSIPGKSTLSFTSGAGTKMNYSFHLKDMLKTDQMTTAPKPIRSGANPVLFSAEERAAYKTDPKTLAVHRRDIAEQRGSIATGAGGKRLGGDGSVPTSIQWDARVGAPLNSDLRATTSDAPWPTEIGRDRKPQDEHPTEGGFRQTTATMDPQTNPGHIQAPAGVGHSTIRPDMPPQEPRIIRIGHPRQTHLAESRTAQDVRRVEADKPSSAPFAVQTTSVAPPFVDLLPDTPASATGLGRDTTHEFPATVPRQSGTTYGSVERNTTTALTSQAHMGAGKFTGAGKPVKTLTIATFQPEGDAGLDGGRDVIFETGGMIVAPLRGPHVRDGYLPPIDGQDTQRIKGEFRRR